MGSLSLERVQFKFASIIGELCSEPDVLSQFAVWLDLRLAEYKLKGNISLDCSGEEPDPIWLKGLSRGRKRKRSSPSLDTLPKIEHNDGSSLENVPLDASDRLSPDIVVVKEEPGPAYPVGLLHVDRNNDSSPGSLRKISPLDSSSSYHEEQWPQQHLSSSSTSTPSKHRRISHPPETVSNQSLMSVISGFHGETQESDNNGDNSVLPSRSIDIDITNDSSDQFNDSTLSSSQFLQESNRQLAMPRDGSASNDLELWTNVQQTREVTLGCDSSREITSVIPGDKDSRLSLLSRIKEASNLPRQSRFNMVHSVSNFENWLWKNFENEKRLINDIPAPELDLYLSHFFTTLTKESGMGYTKETFCSFKCHIDRYLKCTGYGHSISHSHLFLRTQEAYRRRLSLLKSGRVSKKSDSETFPDKPDFSF